MSSPDVASPVCLACGASLVGAIALGMCPRCALDSVLSEGAQSESERAQRPDVPDGFDLIGRIGQGAMAVVWLARERRLDRLVALKLIPNDLDPRVSSRLVREAHALAALRHPHIVAVHSLEKSGSNACLAMDFLEGGDLKSKLAEARLLPPREAAVLVRKLAGALAHAHANGILHRDIKPSNILLDAQGDPRLADFELASPLERSGDVTQPGRVAGTASYLAPELLKGPDRASAASDIYGLGAVLYECLTGRAPIVGDSATSILGQLERVDPPAPRLLQAGIPRDLETVCLKCLEKAPERRYASAAALELDLARWERGESISARPVGSAGKALRWCRRNSLAAASITITAAGVLALAIGGPVVALRFDRARAGAITEAATSKAVADFLQDDLLAQASPNVQPDRELKVGALLDRAAAKVGGRFAEQPAVEASIRETLAKAYSSLGRYDAALRQWDRALQVRQLLNGPEAPVTLGVMSEIVSNLRSQSKLNEAEMMAKKTIELQNRVLGPENPNTLRVMNHLAVIYDWEGRFSEANALATRTLEIRKRVLGPEHPDTLISMKNLAIIYSGSGRAADAVKLNSETLAIKQRVLGPENPSTLNSMHNLAESYYNEGNFAESGAIAVRLLEIRNRVLGPEHTTTLDTKLSVATVDECEGKFAEAEALLTEVINAQSRLVGAGHLTTLLAQTDLATDYRQEGRLSEAEALQRRVLDSYERLYNPEQSDALYANYNLALIYWAQGRLHEAAGVCQKILEIQRRTLAKLHPRALESIDALAGIDLDMGDFAAAEAIERPLLPARIESMGDRWETSAARGLLGAALVGLRRYAEAEPFLLDGYAGMRKSESMIPAENKPAVRTACGRIVHLYECWGDVHKTAEWRMQLKALGPVDSTVDKRLLEQASLKSRL
jgi:tetratricopeptide (TPR) repeat protein